MAWLARWSHNPRNKAIAHLTHVDRIRRIVTKEPLLDDILDDVQRTNRNEQAMILCRIIRHLGSGIGQIQGQHHSVIAVWSAKDAQSARVKYWEIIADNLSKAGWGWGCVSALDSRGRTIFVAEAHRGDGKRLVVRADERLTAFLELERAIHGTLITFL
jgi:hypothetical protein